MRGATSLTSLTATLSLLLALQLAGCEQSQSQGAQSSTAAQGTARYGTPDASSHGSSGGREPWSYQDWPTGPYKVVEDWPKPLPDTRHSHDGWTWGSFGSVYAESPDRIWIAMRGELPLPAGAAPWTPYVALNPRAHGDRQQRRDDRYLRRGAEARLGAAVRAFDLRGGSRRRARRRVAGARQAVQRDAVRPRAASNQDQPIRSREARLDHRRPAAHDLPLHARR